MAGVRRQASLREQVPVFGTPLPAFPMRSSVLDYSFRIRHLLKFAGGLKILSNHFHDLPPLPKGKCELLPAVNPMLTGRHTTTGRAGPLYAGRHRPCPRHQAYRSDRQGWLRRRGGFRHGRGGGTIWPIQTPTTLPKLRCATRSAGTRPRHATLPV